jgi:hypothetical protein
VHREGDDRVDHPRLDVTLDRLPQLGQIAVARSRARRTGEILVRPQVRPRDDLDDLALIELDRRGRDDRALDAGGRVAVDVTGVAVGRLIERLIV